MNVCSANYSNTVMHFTNFIVFKNLIGYLKRFSNLILYLRLKKNTEILKKLFQIVYTNRMNTGI